MPSHLRRGHACDMLPDTHTRHPALDMTSVAYAASTSNMVKKLSSRSIQQQNLSDQQRLRTTCPPHHKAIHARLLPTRAMVPASPLWEADLTRLFRFKLLRLGDTTLSCSVPYIRHWPSTYHCHSRHFNVGKCKILLTCIRAVIATTPAKYEQVFVVGASSVFSLSSYNQQ